ncbi:MAG: radical SAM protein [Pseudomonadota bacterium]
MAHDRLCRYDEIRLIHLEPTARCQAACPMCGRNIAGGRTRGNLVEDEITLDDFRAWIPDDLLARMTGLFMCGNFGEPVLARDCLEMFDQCRRANPRIGLGLNTNGSARKADFWQDLARLRVTVNFGIDGATAASHTRYRRHTNFDRILENAATFIAAGGRAVWDYLIFNHNEAEVDTARAMAHRMGFAKFVVKPTERFHLDHFDVLDDAGELIDVLEPSALALAAPAEVMPDLTVREIACDVAKRGSLFIAASGLVFPCCYLGQLINDRPGAPDSRFDWPTRRSQLAPFFDVVDRIGLANLDLHHRSLRYIVDRCLPEFARHWGVGPDRLMTCAKVCGTGNVCASAR